jgi:hypothetical protein
VPILNFAWAGYIIDLLRNVINGDSQPLPEWSDFGDKFVKGFLITLAGLIYFLPIIILSCIPLGFIFVTSPAERSLDAQEALTVAFTGVGIVFGCLFLIYLIVLSFGYPAICVNFARKGTFGSCFEFSEITKIISTNLSKYLTAWLISIVGGIIVGTILGIVGAVLGFIPCIGWIIGWFIGAIGGVYISTIFAHLFGQVAATPSTSMLTTEM